MTDNEDIGARIERIETLVEHLFERLPNVEDQVNALNHLREGLAKHSPFKHEPVDLVRWVPADSVQANDYNPNTVAPPEMELLRVSIAHDGYTQPIVTDPQSDGSWQVVDGFHRNRVGKEYPEVRDRIHGYLPIVGIRDSQKGRSDRIASTIRHNRARGKHRVDAMSEIVLELKRRNWSHDRIAKELGMEADEVLRLCQMTGLAEAFGDEDFSRAWVAGSTGYSDAEFYELREEDVA